MVKIYISQEFGYLFKKRLETRFEWDFVKDLSFLLGEYYPYLNYDSISKRLGGYLNGNILGHEPHLTDRALKIRSMEDRLEFLFGILYMLGTDKNNNIFNIIEEKTKLSVPLYYPPNKKFELIPNKIHYILK